MPNSDEFRYDEFGDTEKRLSPSVSILMKDGALPPRFGMLVDSRTTQPAILKRGFMRIPLNSSTAAVVGKLHIGRCVPMFHRPLLALCLLVLCSVARGQAPAPTHRDVAYDEVDPAQKLDVYLASAKEPQHSLPAMIHIHGGGWRGGSKNHVPGWLLEGVAKGQFHVVSVEYRFTQVKPHPAQVNDCMRAIQYVRHRAKEWKIDSKHLGVTGGSAGGHLSLWVALHDDICRADAEDPVQRESSRVSCAISFAGPTDWSLLSEIPHTHPAYRQLLGYEPETPANEMDAEAKKDVSPISFVSADDPPVMLVHGDKDDIVPIEHSRRIDERLRAVGVTSELVVVPGANHGVAGAGPQVTAEAAAFVAEHLLGKGVPAAGNSASE